MNSCIYNGIVTHHRFKPVKHSLKYNTFSLFVDLDELEKLHKDIKIFSFNKFNLFSFYNKDHGLRDGSSLKEWVLENLKKFNINGPKEHHVHHANGLKNYNFSLLFLHWDILMGTYKVKDTT